MGTLVSRLPDLDGLLISLDDFRGKRVLLVHWNPELRVSSASSPRTWRRSRPICTPARCNWCSPARRMPNRIVGLALEHGLTCPILLMPDDGPLARENFEKDQGTPVAYLLDEQGKVAQPVAVGGDEILALARGIVGNRARGSGSPASHPLSQSRIERNGLKAGTIAPAFRLPDLRRQPGCP